MEQTQLIIDNISVFARLGVTAKERKDKQEIRWTVFCSVKKIGKKSTNYICYEQIAKKIIEYSTNRNFSLIESMADYCFHQLKEDFPQIKSLRLRLHKIKPPVKHIKGGVFYECGDF